MIASATNHNGFTTRSARVAGVVLILAISLVGCTEPMNTPRTPASSEMAPPAATALPKPSPPTSAEVPVDGGPREGANGTTELDEDGVPVVYIVVEGDAQWGIEQRFGVDGLIERYNRWLQIGERLSLVPEP